MSRVTRRNHLILLSVAGIGLAASADHSLAVDRFWTNAAGGTFTVGSNWSGGVFPGATDSAIFDLASSSGYTVFFPVTLSTDTLRVRNDRVTFNLNARTYTLNNTGFDAVILGQSPDDAGRLTLTNGTLSSSGGVNVGWGSASTGGGAGTLSIDTGGRLVLGADDSLSIGRSSSAGGTVSLVNGGQISGASFVGVGSGGTLTSSLSINGSGSSVTIPGSMHVGATSHGRLSLFGSGASLSTNILAVGQQSSGFGTVTHNSSSAVSVGTLVVGQFGTGYYDLGAASLTTSHVEIGDFGAGTFHLASNGSNWTNSGTLVVGASGPGTLRLDFGADITTGRLLVAEHEGSSGLVVLDDDSTINAGSIDIGAGGVGTLQILRGSDVTATGRLTIGQFQGGSVPDEPSSGTILVDGVGSSLTASGFNIGFTQGDGTVTVRNGAALNTGAGSVNIGGGGNSGVVSLQGTGTSWIANRVDVGSGGPGLLDLGPGTSLVTSGTFTVGTFGTVNVSNASLSVGTLNRIGVLNFSSGTLNVTGAAGLTVGSTGPLGAALVADANRGLNVTHTLNVAADGLVHVDGGRVTAGTFANAGEILLGGGASRIQGTVVNNGLLRGSGQVVGNLTNNATGRLRVDAGEHLRLSGVGTNLAGGRVDVSGVLETSALFQNFGRMFVTDGVVDVSALTNHPTGTIYGRGRFVMPGNFNNQGTVTFSGGVTDVDGPATYVQTLAGKTIVTGNSTTTVYMDVSNNAGTEFRVSTGATAVLVGNVTGLGAFTGSGTTIFEGSASLGVLDRGGTTVVEPSGSLDAQRVREATLVVRGPITILPDGTSDATSRVSRLAIEGGRLNLNDNDLVIDYDGPSPITDVRQQIRSGFNNGSWNGSGIATSAGNASQSGLGYAEASATFTSFPATFSGQSIDDTTVLVAFTRYGDANLNGVVNLQDFNRLAANFGQTDRFWHQGDFNYDGIVNLQDFNRLAANFGLTATGSQVTPENWAALAAAVPEPAAAIAAVALPWLGRVRRRRRC